jgi:Chitobiase/beta-hexosaminidase C-terminal domain
MNSIKMIITGPTTIYLDNYSIESIPEWKQPKIVQTSCITGKKKVLLPIGCAAGKGRFKCRIRIFDADSTIKLLENEDVIDFYLYSDEDEHFNCVVEEYLPIKAGPKHRRINVTSLLLVSQGFVDDPRKDPAAPEATPEGGSFENGGQVNVTLSTPAGCFVMWTTDGTDPSVTNGFLLQNVSIPITHTTTITARAFMTGSPWRFSDRMIERYTELPPQ